MFALCCEENRSRPKINYVSHWVLCADQAYIFMEIIAIKFAFKNHIPVHYLDPTTIRSEYSNLLLLNFNTLCHMYMLQTPLGSLASDQRERLNFHFVPEYE